MLGVKNIRTPAEGKDADAIREALVRAITGNLNEAEKEADKRFEKARSRYFVEWK
ncbi:MAG: capsular biosynthesis protein [Bacteroidales bacterium]|nr:capsular biosynthesis protein [Bacteroidales bacterium]